MKLDWKRPVVIATGLMFIIIAILFEPVIFGGKTFGSPDSLSPKAIGIALMNFRIHQVNYHNGSHGFSAACQREKHSPAYQSYISRNIYLNCFSSQE